MIIINRIRNLLWTYPPLVVRLRDCQLHFRKLLCLDRGILIPIIHIRCLHIRLPDPCRRLLNRHRYRLLLLHHPWIHRLPRRQPRHKQLYQWRQAGLTRLAVLLRKSSTSILGRCLLALHIIFMDHNRR